MMATTVKIDIIILDEMYGGVNSITASGLSFHNFPFLDSPLCALFAAAGNELTAMKKEENPFR